MRGRDALTTAGGTPALQDTISVTLHALGNDQRDVVVLFCRAELPNFIHDGRQQITRAQFTMSPQGFGQSLLSKLFTRRS